MYFFSENNTQGKGNHGKYTDYNRPRVVFLHHHVSHEQTSYHAGQSSQSRDNNKWFKLYLRHAGGVAHHILGYAGYQIEEKDYGVHFL